MICNFHVGQKVVCVDPVDDLKKGAVYTIAIVGRGVEAEFVGVDESHFEGPAFYSWRFRPVITRKTDISQFKAMLNPSKEQVPA